MNKAKLKSYAPQARKDFIAAVTARANLLGLSDKDGQLQAAPSQPQGDITMIAGQAWPAKIHGQRQQLVARLRKDGFAQTLEAVAYTWFNRFAALRYMELHDYLGHGHRALSSEEGTLPDLLTHAADLAQSGNLPGLNAPQVLEMKLAGNRDGELYRLLLVAQCNALSVAMPFLFERIDDETELLLPDNLLRTDSVIAKLVSSIDEADWTEVEIIGWLYQFYISEKKDDVIGKVVKSEDIPAATQLFTPHWIVQYLVQNSVGRLWLMANPQSTLAKEWPYYITPAEQTPKVQAQLDALIQTRMDEDGGGGLNPETITCLDPACGSGHILVVAYDVLKAIYLERGYQPRAIPRLILEKNLYGLDIDDRAAQMAGFALLMKARADDRRLFSEPVKLNVLALQESKGLDADELASALRSASIRAALEEPAYSHAGLGNEDLFPGSRPQMSLGESSGDLVYVSEEENRVEDSSLLHAAVQSLIRTFLHAKTFGSLIQIPAALNEALPALLKAVQQARQSGDLYAQAAAQDVWPLVAQARVLGRQFDAVVANPPYMGSKYLTPVLKSYLKDNYPGYEKDLFSAFMIRDLSLAKPSGQLGFMSPFVWMFISSYEELRTHFIDNATLTSLIQLEYSGFDGATVPICTFTLGKQHVAEFVGSYVRLSDFRGADQQGPRTLEAIQNKGCGWFYTAKPDDFKKIPGNPVAYWISPRFVGLFKKSNMAQAADSQGSVKTGNNDKYIRMHWEISGKSIGPENNWRLHPRGGEYRKWFGNVLEVVNWTPVARLHYRKDHVARIPDEKYWETAGICWSEITSGLTSFRILMSDEIANNKSLTIYPKSIDDQSLIIGYLNSNIVPELLSCLNPTIGVGIGDVMRLPWTSISDWRIEIARLVDRLIEISKADWDEFEKSVDFLKSPLVDLKCLSVCTLNSSYFSWVAAAQSSVSEMKRLEIELNSILVRAFGLEGEVQSDVPLNKITIAKNPVYRYGSKMTSEELTARLRINSSEELISYAIGCMMGRYSLDAPGLIYAHAGNIGFDASRYATFPADADGILPLTDELWFEDDAASRIREFLLAVWGADTLAENMAWLAESLGAKTSETPEETIRRYLADKFFKDHLQTYKKRPIYWLFSSGKQGAFQALVYLHRYNEGTLARLRAEYVVPLTGKIQSRIDMLQKDALAASSTAARNKLAKDVEKLKKKHVELLAYDEQLRHHADMRITLDLDDGVKVNYGRFGNLLAEVKAVTGGKDDE